MAFFFNPFATLRKAWAFVLEGISPGLSQSRWFSESLGLTPAAPRKKRGAGPAEKIDFGVQASQTPFCQAPL